MSIIADWKERVRSLRTDTYVLYLSCRDPRVPWYARILIIVTISYALSPIDLIPDFIPIIGYLDDLIIVPAGIFLALKMVPGEVLAEKREKAGKELISLRTRWVAAVIIILIWTFMLLLLFRLVWKMVFSK